MIKESVVSEIVKEGNTMMEMDRVEYDGMVKVYLTGAEFPLKSAPTPDTLWSLNIIKKTVIEFLKVQTYFSIFFFISKKAIQRVLTSFNRIGLGVMLPYMYYKNFNQGQLNLTPTARGVGIFIKRFLVNYGIEEDTAHTTAELLSHVIEFDSFYRFKLLDLVYEADFSQNPRKEVQRLLQICYDREEVLTTYMRPKLKALQYGAWILIVPSIKRAFQYAVQHTDMSLFDIDEGDYYWMCIRYDYHYFGLTNEERMDIVKKKGWKVITPTTV